MAVRARLLGYGEPSGETEEEGYYGPSNPGHQLAQAVYQARGAKRADEQAAALEQERKETAAYRAEQRKREEAMDPITRALARAHLAGLGVRWPGEAGGDAASLDPGFTTPPAGVMAPGGGTRGTARDPGFTAP